MRISGSSGSRLTAHIRIKDKNGDTALDLLPAGDTEIRALVRKAQAQASVSRDDVASGAICLFARYFGPDPSTQTTMDLGALIPAQTKTRSHPLRILHDCFGVYRK